MFVRVAIDLALDRLFDYGVPAELSGKLAIGQLLSVPFGPRQARGFALSLHETSAVPPERVRPVAAIVDETPFFSAALLKLVRALSDYTAAPIESVLRAAVPAAVLKRSVRAREQLYVEPLGTGPAPALTARQRWLLDQVVRLGGGWLGQLCTELATTPATLRALAEKGAISIQAQVRRRDPLAGRRILPSRPLALNAEQAHALAAIAGARQPVLLWGVTGSGKTEVYLQAIAAELAAGRGAIVMVPEIALTPQTVRRFASRFGTRVAVLHSALSDGERYDEWHRIRSGEARVVVGPRSAVFAPVRQLGIVIVDEEHEPSYKQDETPRYNARDAAVLRGTLEGAKVVLGSATPSLESWFNVRLGKYALVHLAHRAGSGTLPVVHLVDMACGDGDGKRTGGIFSEELMDALRVRLDRHEQTILLLNRRGYARSVSCSACGHTVSCPRCSAAEKPLPYTYHRADGCLRCHICGGWVPLPEKCPACGSRELAYQGLGTQRAEAALRKCFPRAGILRMDADTVSRRHSHDDILAAFGRHEADVLIGTQMIAKGLDFPNVTLVGVLNADGSLNQPDFRAAERTFQLLAQVAGRAGRAELAGEVFIQTYDTQAPVLRLAARGDFAAFAEQELRDREEAGFPPYGHLATVNLRSRDAEVASAWANMYAASLEKYAAGPGADSGLCVTEAMPAALEKADGVWRWQIVLRAPVAKTLVRAWRWLVGVRPPPAALVAVLDVDAHNLG